jgi:hypothetical protein
MVFTAHSGAWENTGFSFFQVALSFEEYTVIPKPVQNR